MTFKEIQDAVLSDRFREPKRGEVKKWINARYGRVWAREPWAFKLVFDQVTLPAGENTVSKGNIQRIYAIWDQTAGATIWRSYNALRAEDFFNWANINLSIPSEFTVIGGTIYSNTKASSDRTLYVLGERKFAPLVNDNDVPLIPDEFHYMLVHGASSEGLRIENDPTWQGFEQDFQAYHEDMKRAYLTEVFNASDSYPAWP